MIRICQADIDVLGSLGCEGDDEQRLGLLQEALDAKVCVWMGRGSLGCTILGPPCLLCNLPICLFQPSWRREQGHGEAADPSARAGQSVGIGPTSGWIG